MASRGGEKRGGSEGSPKPTVSAMRKTPSVGSVRSQEDQLSLSYQGDRWSSDSSWLSDSAGSDSAGSDSAGSDSAGSDSEHVEGALDQPQHDVCLEDPCELHRAARSGDVPGVERVLAPGDPGVNKRDRKESLWHLIPECKMEQSPESLPQNNNPDWHPTNLTVSDKTCQKSKILSVDDQCPSVSPSMPENQSAAKELGQMNLTEQEKMNVSGNGSLHDLCQSQLPENKESKEAEQDLELTSEEEQERLKGHENKQPQKMSQEPEMAKDCDREDIPVYSILPHAQKSEEMWIEQGKLEWKNKLKLVTNELKQRFGEIRETYKIPVCPEEEPLLDNSMRKTNVKDIPFNLTNNIPGCVEEDASEVSVSVVFETFPEQNEPSLKSIIHPYFHPYSGSLQHACQSSSKLHLHENKLDCDSDNKPGVEHIFSMDENFSNDAGTKKARNPEEVTVEMKEDQEFDLQMTKNMNQNSDSCSTNNYKSLKPKLENLSSLPPDSYRTSEVYLHEELQQDMQKPKTEVDRVEEMFLALKKENVQLQKEKSQRHSESEPSLQSEDAEDADELLRVLSTDLEFLDLDQISPEEQQISSPARQPSGELQEITHQMPQDELGREKRDLEPESREEGQERRVCDIQSKAGISRQSLMSSTTEDILFQKDESAWVYPLKSQRHSESEPSLQSEDAEDADELLRVLSTDLEFLDLDQISPEEQQISSPARQPSGELQEITHQMPQDELGRERRDLEPESREEGQERRVCDIQSKAGISRPSLMSSTTDDTLFQKDESAWVYPLVEEEVEKQRSNSTELSGNPAHGAAAGNNDDGLNQQFPRKKKKGHDRPADKTSNEKNKVKNQVHPEADFADSVGPSETASEDCELSHSTYENFLLLIEQLGMECKDSVSLSRIQDTFCFYEHLLKLKNNDYEQLTVKIKQTENMVSVLQKELSETKKTELQLELQKIELEKQLYSLRLALKQEKEEKGNAVMLYNKYSERLRLKEEECGKEVEMKQRLKWTLRRLVKELKTVRNNLDLVVQERNDVQKQLSEEQNARILQDQILTSKQKELEIAQKKINSEISHRHKKEKDLLHENCMLQEEIALLRLEIDTVNNQNQQKEKKYFEDIEVVKEKNDNLQKIIKLNEEKLTKTILQYSGQLNDLTAENKILNSELENKKQNQERLEIEMESYRCRLAAALRDCDESQTSRDPKLDFQRTRQEWVHLQDKKKVDMSDLQAKTEILSEKLSNAESKISSLQIQLHNTRDAVERKSLILERLQRDLSQTHCEKKEIEQMYQTEQHKLKKYIAKQESVEERLSQLQSENTLLPQQLDDAHKKANSQEKTISTIQDQFHAFAKNLQAESEKKILSLQEKNKELMDEYNHLQERMHQCEKEKARRKVVMRQLQQEWTDPLKQQPTSEATSRCHINLDETLNSKKKLGQIRSEVDLIEAQETAPLRCLHLDAENEVLQLQQTLFSMKAIRKQCETLQKNKKQLKREVVNLKSYMERNMLECVEAEQHKLLIEEKAKKEIAEKLNEAILTLQKQAAVSQEQLAQLREDNTTSVKTQMELTIKNLESEISRINTSSADFNKTELERYKELYLEEVKVRESLSNELNRTNEKIAEVSAQLTVEKELTRSPFAACSTRPILEPPCAGNLNDSEDLNRKHIPRKKKSAPESMESYLLKMQQKLQNDITREVTAATKCEPEPYVASPPESAYQKNLNQDPVLEATKEYAQILSRKYMI
ncbi:coiled-coil domain-containing protein 144A isoform X4 [Macaca thibetana thibetana]|uniref:coiled-coil domain-containing protein 144A isoform X4 n=1 Tax=Macaca thibetana thibetana TaxID=257877 RepID=UPI0021BCBF9F|nr:coiled-coil domain-containing protein 144A isoform X4 [Macaca thibetana thibetana]